MLWQSKYLRNDLKWAVKFHQARNGPIYFTMPHFFKFVKAMKELPIIPIDDAFIGVCLRKLGLRPTNHKGFKSWGIKYLEQNNCVWNEVMTFHKLQPEELEQMWKAFIKRGMVSINDHYP